MSGLALAGGGAAVILEPADLLGGERQLLTASCRYLGAIHRRATVRSCGKGRAQSAEGWHEDGVAFQRSACN